MRTTATAILGLLLAVPASAETTAMRIHITGGKADRKNVPVTVPLKLSAIDAKSADELTLTEPDGRPVRLFQVTKAGITAGEGVTHEIHFVVPRIKAGETLTYIAATNNDAGTADTFPVPAFASEVKEGEFRETRYDGRLVARYMCRTFDDSTPQKRFMSYKPFHHLFDPSDGEQRLTRGPIDGKEKTFPHHRGMFFGYNRVSYGDKKADVWHCRNDDHQKHEEFLSQESGPAVDRMTARITWRGPGKEAFAEEDREITFYAIPDGTLVEFVATVKPLVDVPVNLDGDPQHAGVQFRAIEEVASSTKGQTYYLRPDGKGKIGETRNWEPKSGNGPINMPWNAVSFVTGGDRYTVVYLDHPDNPKPARYSERDYARFGSYFEYTLTKDKPLTVRYRFWLQNGEMTVEQCEELDGEFVDPPKVTVKYE